MLRDTWHAQFRRSARRASGSHPLARDAHFGAWFAGGAEEKSIDTFARPEDLEFSFIV
ncbi:conserved hypothetical protein [Mesorhizobium ventifaucium]|uniref:Uncharacterized protein n=1 Tax=Mesorhizobium ventifaucium TaxID=666020 RepID=A0ABN8K195_9HYPH|nr:conserved hypothetical protein [Mesorhizobium ventifaucium]